MRITRRKEVFARPIADSGSDGAFLGSGADDMFAASSSLDAPLASALSASLSPGSVSQQILSSNAYWGGKGTSWEGPCPWAIAANRGTRVRSPSSPPPTSGSGTSETPGIKREFGDNALFEFNEGLLSSIVAEVPVEGGVLWPSRSAESASGSVLSAVPDMILSSPELEADWGKSKCVLEKRTTDPMTRWLGRWMRKRGGS